MKTMKAMTTTKFGRPEVLQLDEVNKPTPKDDEVLVKNYATSINTVDVAARAGRLPSSVFPVARVLFLPLFRMAELGLRKPRKLIPGNGFAGTVEAVGKGVIDWKVGDEVYGYYEGACAQFLSVPASLLAKKPNNLNFEEAAAVIGGSTPAIMAMRDVARPEPGQKVLIIGASGGIGTFAVQMAKMYGAEVTGVCSSKNLELVKRLGADHVIAYDNEDYFNGSEQYDIIFDVPPIASFSKCKPILTENGVYVSNNPINTPKHIIQLMIPFGKKKLKTGVADESADNYSEVGIWIEEGKIKPVVDTVYPLSQLADAHRHYETGHSKGRVVVSISHNGKI